MSTMAPIAAAPAATRERVELILAELDRLPALPPVAARVLQLAVSTTSSAREITELVRTDPALTASLLRMLRRADRGVRGEVVDVSRAVTLLGLRTVRNAVLAVQIHDLLPVAVEQTAAANLRRELWKHALATACAAEMLAEYSGRKEIAGEAFVAGLLHDIGKIALECRFPKAYGRIAERVAERVCICDAERELLALDHTLAGKRLAARWHLPEPVVECVWLHHQAPDALPAGIRHPDLIRLVHLADQFIREQRIGFSGYRESDSAERIAGMVGVSKHSLSRVATELPERMAPFFELIGLDDSAARTVYTQSLADANRELAQVNADLLNARNENAGALAVLEAIRFFQALRRDEHDIADLCATMARSALVWTHAPRALVVAWPLGLPGYQAAGARSVETAATRFVEADAAERAALVEAVARGTARDSITAPESLKRIWSQFWSENHAASLEVFYFGEEQRAPAALILERTASDECLLNTGDCTGGWAVLGGVFTAAVAAVHARRDAERITEELFDMQRRNQAGQNNRVRNRSVDMIAQMAAGAAHELNNPLAVIAGRAQILLTDAPPEQSRPLQVIVDQAHMASGIINELMNFARPETPKPVALPLVDVLQSRFQYWRGAISPDDVEFSFEAQGGTTTVYADAVQTEEIIDAVVQNAVDAVRQRWGAASAESLPAGASPRGNRPRVTINSPAAKSDDMVRIEVCDNGTGMPPDVLEHAIDPFFSSRPAGRGRGLGLSRACRLVDCNGGRLWLDSEPGMGTTVTIELPTRPPATHP